MLSHCCYYVELLSNAFYLFFFSIFGLLFILGRYKIAFKHFNSNWPPSRFVRISETLLCHTGLKSSVNDLNLTPKLGMYKMS